MRYVVIGYTAKTGNKEFTSIQGYELEDGKAIPGFDKIRSSCLSWANRDGDNFSFLQMNFISELSEIDYKSLMSK